MDTKWERILDDDSLSAAERYARLRQAFPTFGDWTIRFAIHEACGRARPFSYIDRLLEGDLESTGQSPGAALAALDSQELHYFTMYYVARYGVSYDDCETLDAVVCHEACDRGTALFIYWAALDGLHNPDLGELEEGEDDEMIEEYYEMLRSTLGPFARQVESKLLSESFPLRNIAYDPKACHDSELLALGSDVLSRPSPGSPFDEFGPRIEYLRED